MKGNIIGKYAYKKSGFFSGRVGIVEKNKYPISEYVLVYKSGFRNCFNYEREITLVENLEQY